MISPTNISVVIKPARPAVNTTILWGRGSLTSDLMGTREVPATANRPNQRIVVLILVLFDRAKGKTANDENEHGHGPQPRTDGIGETAYGDDI